MKKRGKGGNLRFLFFLFVIGFVSAYDTALIYIYSEDIVDLEQNPIGSWLLAKGGVSLFVDVKSVCTLLAIVVGLCVVKNKYRVALIPVLLFQIALFYYLTFYESMNVYGLPLKTNPFLDFLKFQCENFGF